MSTAPGVQVTTLQARRRPRTGVIPGTLFVSLIAQRGPSDRAVECGSMRDVEAVFGAEVTSSVAYQELRAQFGEGAPRAFVARIVGPGAAVASIALPNALATPTTALTIRAVEPGAYWNATTVAVAVSGTNFTLTIVRPDGVTHTSPTLADLAAAVTWVNGLEFYTATSTGTDDPAARAATPMTGGTDDTAGITETQRQNAMNLFERRLGPGTVLEPGTTTIAGARRIALHAQANNRIALVDAPTNSDRAALIAHAAALRNNEGMHRVKLNASFARVSGMTQGSLVTVGWSSIEAGMLGRNDRRGVSAGQPAAGAMYGESALARSLVTEYSDPDRGALNDAHVNVAVAEDGRIIGMGNRSLSTVPGRTLFSMQRTLMVIQAEAEQAGRAYVHQLTDGQDVVLSKLMKDLVGICQRHMREGSLFGASEDEAFIVNVFDVNTDENLLAGIIYAAIDVRPAGAAEFVRINITSHADTIAA